MCNLSSYCNHRALNAIIICGSMAIIIANCIVMHLKPNQVTNFCVYVLSHIKQHIAILST